MAALRWQIMDITTRKWVNRAPNDLARLQRVRREKDIQVSILQRMTEM